MVLKLLYTIMLTLLISGCSAIGYIRYEEKAEKTKQEEITQKKSTENKYIVKEYYLVPEEWWFDYPAWRWSFGFYLWEPYWWYPYYSTRCPGCYLFDPYVFKQEHRKFERKNTEMETPSGAENPERSYNSDSPGGSTPLRHRQFGR